MTTLRLSATALAAVLVLAGCNKANDGEDGNATAAMALPDLPATLPLEAGDANGMAEEIEFAPAVSDLPDVTPLKMAQVANPSDSYGYADAAYAYDEALGDAPPDYGFDYEDTDPWAWQGYDGSTMYAEPIDDGYRYYYYRPGAEEPYFVRDPYYSYGFAGGMLAAVYALDGGLVPFADYGPRLGYASRYFSRGRDLYRFGRRARRRPVVANLWVRRSPIIFGARNAWGQGRIRQPLWASYHRANLPRLTRYWQPERVRRAADADRFAGWRQSGFRAAPPPRAIPAAWAGQRWARDNARYRPASDTVRERVQRQDRDRRNDRRDDRQGLLADRRQDQRQDRRNDARGDRGQNARIERRDDRQALRDQRREQAQARQQNARRDEARPNAGRRDDARQGQQAQRERQQAQRQQAQQHREQAQRQRQERQQAGQQRQQAEARRDRQQGQRAAAQARREEAQARRQQVGSQRDRDPGERIRRQREDGERFQRQNAERAQAREQQRAEQAQRVQRQRDDTERAQRQQRDMAERGQRQQQMQMERQQRQQQMQAERQQRQQQAQPRGGGGGGGGAEQRQAAQQQRQQVREQRQQNRAERREGRGGGRGD
jgi:hypothetical protein